MEHVLRGATDEEPRLARAAQGGEDEEVAAECVGLLQHCRRRLAAHRLGIAAVQSQTVVGGELDERRTVLAF